MKTKTINLYTYDDLSESAKDVDLVWYSSGCLDYEWWDCVYDVAKQVGLKITSFDLDRNRHACGSLQKTIYQSLSAIRANHGKDCDTFKLAEEYDAKLTALGAEPQDSEAYDTWTDAIEDLTAQFEKDLLEEYSIMLQKEYEYQTSREVLEESIRANEYTFRENGKRED